MKKVLILFVMAIAMNVTAQESVLLRLNYKSGDSYLMNMKMSQDVGTMMSMDMNMKMSQEIVSVTGDNYVSKMKITFVGMDMSQGGMNMSFDSTKSDDELDATGKMMKAQMGPMLQAVITTKGNKMGVITETSVEPNVPGTSDLAEQSSSVEYPEKALRVGDTWEMTKSQKGLKTDFVYKVKSITKEMVLLDVSGKVTGAGEGTVSGELKIDRNSGVPLTSAINMNVNMNGQEMVSKVNITMTKQ